MDLKGTVAVVTGGNGGLGQRICHALAAQGCHIAVVYTQSKDQAAGVARDLEKHQVGAAAFACDVTQRDQVQRLVDDVVKRFGRLDILVNDAAYNKSIPFTDLDNLTYEEWTKIIDINLTGPMLLTKAVGPVMVLVRHIVTTWSATSSLSAALPSSDALRPISTCSGRRFAVARVPSSRPGATQFTSTWGASATAMHLVRWIRPALETA